MVVGARIDAKCIKAINPWKVGLVMVCFLWLISCYKKSGTGNESSNVVLEEQEISRKFKFLTWNIWFKKKGIEARTKYIIDQIHKLDIDFVALQEVTKQSLSVIKANNKNYTIIGDLNQQYDTILLSKYECTSIERIFFKKTSMGRNMLSARFKIKLSNNEFLDLCVGTFHLESPVPQSDNSLKRAIQFKEATASFEAGQAIVIMGDTNFPGLKEVKLPPFMSDSFITAGCPSDDCYTYDCKNKNTSFKSYSSRFDRIYFTNHASVKKFLLLGKSPCIEVDEGELIPPSDHYGVLSELEFYIRKNIG
jgi:endonuclease/exonuclease/phosphatase family metal-dependent hydrolase